MEGYSWASHTRDQPPTAACNQTSNPSSARQGRHRHRMASPQSGMSNRPKQSSAEAEAAQKTPREIIEKTTPEDYDGHTEFSRMTPAQRLAWLDQAGLFIQSRKQSPGTWQGAEETPP